MRKLIRKVYLKIRIYLIILLAIVIGASYMFVYEKISDLFSDYNESMVIWNDYKSKDDGAAVSAAALVKPLEEGEVQLPSPEVESKIRSIAKRENFKNADLLVRIAKCESGLVPDRRSDVVGSSATGLYQFTKGTWQDGCKYMNVDWSLADRCNAEKSTLMTIYFIKRGELTRWTASSICWNKLALK